MELLHGDDRVGGRDRTIELWVVERHLALVGRRSLSLRIGEVGEKVIERRAYLAYKLSPEPGRVQRQQRLRDPLRRYGSARMPCRTNPRQSAGPCGRDLRQQITSQSGDVDLGCLLYALMPVGEPANLDVPSSKAGTPQVDCPQTIGAIEADERLGRLVG